MKPIIKQFLAPAVTGLTLILASTSVLAAGPAPAPASEGRVYSERVGAQTSYRLYEVGRSTPKQNKVYKPVGIYVGLGYALQDVNGADLDAATVKVGVEGNDYFSGELRGGMGLSDDDGVELDRFVGLYGKLLIPNSSHVTPYVIAGYTHTELTVAGNSDTGSSLSYGLGMDVQLTKRSSVSAEAMRYYDNGGATIDGLGVSFEVLF